MKPSASHFAAALAAQALLALALVEIHAASGSSLAATGHWVATKTTLERGLMGAEQFLHGKQAVSGQKLNLAAWHGFQEVIYRELVDPVEIRARISLGGRSHVSVIFDRDAAGFAGARLSLDPVRPSMVFRATPDGEFLQRWPLRTPGLAAHREHEVSVAFDADALRVRLDGAPAGAAPPLPTRPQQVGFRGGARNVVVSDVVIRRRGGGGDVSPEATLYESFRPRPRWDLAAGVALAVLVANGAWIAGRARRGGAAREALLGATVANLTLATLAGLGLCYLRMTAERYPAADAALRAGEHAWRLGQADEIRAEVRRQCPGPPPGGTARVLFLGSSQTWGAGAAHVSDTIPATLQRLLDAQVGAGRYQVVNGAICSVDSAFLRGLYEREWAALKAELVVVNLSNNDTEPGPFGDNLRRIAQIARDAGSRALFVLEANSGELRPAVLEDLARRHVAMRVAAEAEGVPVVDMHAHLLELQDRGFLFWDLVHMTSFGQRLAAERLLPEVLRLVEAPSAGRPLVSRQRETTRPTTPVPNSSEAGRQEERPAPTSGRGRDAVLLQPAGGLGARDLELAGRLDVERLHHAVDDRHREAAAAHAHAELAELDVHAQRLRVVGVAVGQHHDLAVGAGALAPGVHHEHVVDREAGDGVDALLLDLVELADVAGQVLARAGGRVRPRHPEQDHLLAGEQLGRGDRRRALVRHLRQRALGHALPDLDRHLVYTPALAKFSDANSQLRILSSTVAT